MAEWRERAAPHVRLPGYERGAVTPKIAHFGVGNFFRVHAARYLDDCLHVPGQTDWGIIGIGVLDSPQSRAKAAAYADQDGLYTVTEYAPDGAATARVIGAMIDYLYAPDDPAAVVDTLAGPNIRIVSLTLTEGGYFQDQTTGTFDAAHPDIRADVQSTAPRTAFGMIVAALRRRRAGGVAPFTVLSCDNLRGNGDTARQAVVGYAAQIDPELARWIDAELSFPNSMVDRIAPSVTPAIRDRVNAATGLPDALPAIAETFSQWVVQDRFSAGRPRLDEVGVELRDDVALFEAVKGRILNASHMLLAYPAILAGHRLVHDAMADPRFPLLLRRFLQLDVLPFVQGPAGLALGTYIENTLERFGNPAVGDQLLRIAADGASKIPTFHARTTELLLHNGADPIREAFLLAAYRRSLRGVDEHGQRFDVTEPALNAADRDLLGGTDPLDALKATPFAALRLWEQPAFIDAYLAMVDSIDDEGIDAALRRT
ncbi:mannitol dehydrogenase family protein [Nakamurella sp. DB0629]|uniref:Mannitol-1-phosphate 5-dehydrogenase n=1 Tax=Nakamurella aerolata TaxID=1656892 RepID=A0A849A9K2_9ACTN|nr:mannitol dehydrogenase family protein [Nakamurella aerolata]